MNLIYTDLQLAPRARRSDPSTSHAAAKRAATFASSHAGRILTELREGHYNLNGATAEELGLGAGLSTHQTLKRLPELQALGLCRVLQEDGRDAERNGFRLWVTGAAQ